MIAFGSLDPARYFLLGIKELLGAGQDGFPIAIVTYLKIVGHRPSAQEETGLPGCLGMIENVGVSSNRHKWSLRYDARQLVCMSVGFALRRWQSSARVRYVKKYATGISTIDPNQLS